jgi:DNA-binding IclR family transcriptional regulator
MSDNKQTRATNYVCEAQQRVLFVLMALAGHEVDGVSLTSIALALAQRTGKTKQGQKNNVFRDLHNLKEAGLAEQLPDSDLWRLTPRMVQISTAYQRYLDRATARLDETRQRFGREI